MINKIKKIQDYQIVFKNLIDQIYLMNTYLTLMV